MNPALERLALRGALQKARPLSFRDFLYSDEYAGPYMAGTGVSPAIEAIALASEGRPIPEHLLSNGELRTIFRCGRAGLTGIAPRVVLVGAGRRGGKTSNLLAPRCVHAAWVTPIPTLKQGEIARSVIISPDTDQSGACFDYCRGIVESSPVLSRAIEKITTEQILLRRPDGKMVEIVVGAASRGGKAARSRSVVFAGLDEAAFFYPDGSYVANDKDIFDAVLGTIKFLQGAQVWLISTPFVSGMGLMEKLIEEYWGKPGFALVAARISSYLLRGVPDDGSLREGMDEDAYRCEILAEPLPAGSSSYFTPAEIKTAYDASPPEASPEALAAGMDIGHINDNSGVAIAARYPGGIFAPVHVREIPSSAAQKPTSTYETFAEDLVQHGIREVVADSQAKANVIEVLDRYRIRFIDRTGGNEPWIALKNLLQEGRLALGGLSPRDRDLLIAQMRQVIRTHAPGGAVQIKPVRARPKDIAAGRATVSGHADLLDALRLALYRVGSADPHLWHPKPKLFGPGRGSGRSGGPSGDRAWSRDDLRW